MTGFALASYRNGAAVRSALVLDGALYDLVTVAEHLKLSANLVTALARVDDVIMRWDSLENDIMRLAGTAGDACRNGDIRPVADGGGKLAVPFAPYRVFGAASNYVEHAAEMETKLAAKADSTPFVFMKSQSSVIGPGDAVVIPPETRKADWEVELGAVIGRPGRRISWDRAIDHIAGYVVVNDISARDLTRRTDFPFSHDWFRGKSFDTFTPMGPWFVPRACIADPHALKLTLDVNGERMQDGHTSEMIFDTFEQIAYLSSLLTLRPGDVIATGTPAGVGMGRGVFLKPGDTMVATIDGIGTLENPVVAEDL